VTPHERAEVVARTQQEAGGVVLLTHMPTAGARAPRAGEVLRAYREQHGVAQHVAFLPAPVMVHWLFLQKPAQVAAWGGVFLRALLLGRLVERPLRVHVETPGHSVGGRPSRPPRSQPHA
jgi:hypothetical protein